MNQPAGPQPTSPPRAGGATLAATGMAVPKRVMSNHDLEKIVDTTDEWIMQRTGIRERRISEAGDSTSGLATEATRNALESAGLEPGDLDLLICATMTPDMICPATACQVVANLGAVPCGAMDVNIACSGFVASLNMAANFIASGFYRNVAVVGAEQLSKVVDWDDRRTCVLFGDGAGAAIVSATEEPERGCLYQSLHSDGRKWRELYCPRTEDQVPEGAGFSGKCDTLQMNGREVYKFAVSTLQRTIQDAMAACNLGPDDISLIVPHQSNDRILSSAREKLGVPEGKMYINLDRYGNTSAASVGICLAELSDQGRLGEGDIVILVGLGGGLTWATSVWKL